MVNTSKNERVGEKKSSQNCRNRVTNFNHCGLTDSNLYVVSSCGFHISKIFFLKKPTMLTEQWAVSSGSNKITFISKIECDDESCARWLWVWMGDKICACVEIAQWPQSAKRQKRISSNT